MLKQKATFLSLCIFDISKHPVKSSQRWHNAVNDKLLQQPLTNHSRPGPVVPVTCWLSINGYFGNIIIEIIRK